MIGSGNWPVVVEFATENKTGLRAIIDTGAKLAYGRYPDPFDKSASSETFEDYNPALGEMRSSFYLQSIRLGDKTSTLMVGDDPKVVDYCLKPQGVTLVMSIADWFFEAVVFDFQNREIILG